MKKLICSFLCAIGLSGCTDKAVLTPIEFTNEYAAKLQKTFPAIRVKIKAEMELRIIGEDGKENTAYLDNSYTSYKSDPENKNAIIEKYLAAFIDPSIRKDAVDRDRITPVIKDRAWISEIQESMKARGAKKPLKMFMRA